MTSRLTHRSTDRLPDPARSVLRGGIEAGLPARAIVENLAALGFIVSERTVGRRAQEWRAERTRDQAVQELIRLGSASSWSLEEVFAILDRLDFKPGWYQKGARQISKLIRAYAADPGAAGLREVVLALAAFGVASKLQEATLSRLERGRLAPEYPITTAKGGLVA